MPSLPIFPIYARWPWGDDDRGDGAGAAYVFRFDGTDWIEETKLTAADAAERDLFGFPVSLSQSQAFIGALRADTNGQDSGAAYVFARRNVGNWRQQKLAPTQGEFNDFFRAGSIDGNLLIAGAPGDDSACSDNTFCDAGAAYLFRRIGSTWQQQLHFFASDAVQPLRFGLSSCLDGENAVVGSSGAAYVFTVERHPDGIPALSSWGLVAMLLLLLVAAKVFFRGRENRKLLGRSRISALCVPLLLSGIVQSVSAQAPDLSVAHHPEHILVRFFPGTTDTKIANVNAQIGAVRLKKYRFVSDLYLVKVAAVNLEGSLNSYFADLSVRYAEPDYVLTPTGNKCTACDVSDPNCPDDFSFQELWGLHNTGQTLLVPQEKDPPLEDPGTCDADIDALEAWNHWTGELSPGFRVAVFDVGVDYTHEDFVDGANYNIWINPGEDNGNGIIDGDPGAPCGPTNGDFDCVDNDMNGWVDDLIGYDFGDDDPDPKPEDFIVLPTDGHGTHVAGTIGAMGDNSIGVSGVLWRSKIVPIKTAGDGSISGLISAIIEGLEYCMANGIRISNHSWLVATDSLALEDAIKRALDFGHVLVVSAGNANIDVDNPPPGLQYLYPCIYDSDNIICVAATDNDDNLGAWEGGGTNWGLTSCRYCRPRCKHMVLLQFSCPKKDPLVAQTP